MRKCLNCGREYQDENVRFCDCGGPVVETNQEPYQNLVVEQISFDDSSQTSAETQTNNQTQTSNTTIDNDFDEIEIHEQPNGTTVDSEDENYDILAVIEEISEIEDQDEETFIDFGNEEIMEDANEDTKYEFENEFKENLESEIDELEEFISSDPETLLDSEDDSDSQINNGAYAITNIDVTKDEDPREKQDENEKIISKSVIRDEESTLVNIFSDVFGEDSEKTEDEIVDSTEIPKRVTKQSDIQINQDQQTTQTDEIYEKIRIRIYKNKKLFYDNLFSHDEIKIGRSITGVEIDINLKDFDQERVVSRHHVTIFKFESKYYLINKSLKNPVTINGKRIPQETSVPLHDGDKIVLSNRIGILVTKD